MATGQSIVKRALRLIGVVASSETLSANELADGLEAANAMIDSWRTERLLVYATRTEVLTMVPGQASYTIGPSGDLDTARPVSIDDLYLREAGIDTHVRLLNDAEWAAIGDKNSGANIVEFAYYQATMPAGTLYVYPVPTAANTLHLTTWTPLAGLAPADAISLPPGYEDALAFNLAARVAPEYGRATPPEVAGLARSTKAAIKRANGRAIRAYTELRELVGPVRSNIITGP